MLRLLDAASQVFHELKTPRQLEWKMGLGSATLQIELEEVSNDFITSPILASLILFFEDGDEHSVHDLALACQLPVALVFEKLSKWVNYGILKESRSNCFRINRDGNQRKCKPGREVSYPISLEEDTTRAAKVERNHSRVASYSAYIVGMLTNLGSLSREAIHNMMKMFADPGPHLSSFDQRELDSLLTTLRHQEIVDFDNGMYSISKPS
mmetsp:Transcript_12149/g.36616  ORF Transcript_12149/g.36616 Transcript_12149/m.36616 type:complete len:210 (+) Transcript_12149:863-1492(+)